MEVCASVELYIEKTILTTQNSKPQIERNSWKPGNVGHIFLPPGKTSKYAFCELQKHIAMVQAAGKYAVCATEMLASMEDKPFPTRHWVAMAISMKSLEIFDWKLNGEFSIAD